MSNFSTGQSSLEVCQSIVRGHKEILNVNLVSHYVGFNWRQIYSAPESRAKNYLEAIKTHSPLETRRYSREDFQALSLDDLENPFGEVWSVCSKIDCGEDGDKHIPMMNFHLDNAKWLDLLFATREITSNRKGVILDSGRFYHYYGDYLLDQEEWLKFMGSFILPGDVFVSPRYIGCRLVDGYGTLRLTSDQTHKPKVPCVIQTIE